jgi:hypothetical protein
VTFAMTFNARRAKPKPTKSLPKLLDHKCFMSLHGDSTDMPVWREWVLQLPIVTHADNANGAHFTKARAARSQLDVVLLALQTQLRGVDRERIDRITLVRFSPGKLDAHDNLRQAFKHVLDGVCVWICCGTEDFNRRAIGKYDDQLLGTGKVTCHYEQTTHDTNKRLQGIQIRLRLAASSR